MKHTFTALLLLCAATNVFAQSSADSTGPKLNITGYVDVYYKYNFNGNATDNLTSFTNSQNSFELGMASVKFQEQYKKAEFVADLGFGKRAEEFSYNDANTLLAIKQLYVDYAFSDHFKLTMGSYDTHMGWELVDPTGNTNYSMSYCFSYGPFFNTGLKADFTFGKWTAMVGVFDPTDHKSNFYNEYDGVFNNRKNIGGQLTYSPSSAVKIYMNYLEGKDSSGVSNNQLDPIITIQATPKFNIVLCEYFDMFKAPSTSTQSWTSSALYLTYNFTPVFGLSLRSEYFTDKDNLAVFTDPIAYPNGGNILSFTLSGNVHLGNLTFIPEVRMDNASQTIFTKGNANTPTQTTTNVLFAAYYAF
jgi:Putative beta-barrel porin-2, OmpL-like. bbp2